MNKKIFLTLFLIILALGAGMRLAGITKFPPSLYWEEVALGYDAYSISETGRDHHGHPWPIVAFESFGDWKPALYFYTIVPFIKVLGLTGLAVRLPAALSGVAIMIGVGYLAKELTRKKHQHQLQLIAMLVTAISPWAVQFSRAAWEVNLATALILWGVILFMKGINKSAHQLKYLISGSVLLVLSTYAYHSARVVAPLLGLSLVILWIKNNRQNWTYIFITAGIAVILFSPILLSLGKKTTTQRFAETSIFSNLAIIEESNARKAAAGNTLMSRIVYHRYLLFGKQIIGNFLDHFNFDFLFISGDNNPRHSIQYVGTFYHFELLFLILGIFSLFKQKNKYRWFLCWWLVIGILPPALTKTTPHALRILPTLPVWMILITFGIKQSLDLAKKHHLVLLALMILIYLGELTMFWRFYSKIYPTLYASEWQDGYQEKIMAIESLRAQNPDKIIYVSREDGRPAMYYWFYTQTDPREVQAAEATAKKDQGEFLEFKNLRFE